MLWKILYYFIVLIFTAHFIVLDFAAISLVLTKYV
jgi:hypothetical protein